MKFSLKKLLTGLIGAFCGLMLMMCAVGPILSITGQIGDDTFHYAFSLAQFGFGANGGENDSAKYMAMYLISLRTSGTGSDTVNEASQMICKVIAIIDMVAAGMAMVFSLLGLLAKDRKGAFKLALPFLIIANVVVGIVTAYACMIYGAAGMLGEFDIGTPVLIWAGLSFLSFVAFIVVPLVVKEPKPAGNPEPQPIPQPEPQPEEKPQDNLNDEFK